MPSERMTTTVWVASKSAKPNQMEAIQNHCDFDGRCWDSITRMVLYVAARDAEMQRVACLEQRAAGLSAYQARYAQSKERS